MNDSIVEANSTGYISRRMRFWLYFVFFIPSLLCSIFVLFHFLSHRNLRRSLNNHVIIVLLLTVAFCQLTMYPWMLYYYSLNDIWYRSFTFCVIWGFFDWSIYMLQLLLFAWASIERHILIFHDKWLTTSRQQFLLHYLPLIILIVYWTIFYSFVYFYPSCENIYDTSVMLCATPCLFNSVVFRAFETFFNNILPNFIIIISSLTLLMRIVWQKYRIRQPMHWRKHRKMTIQILSISALYLLITLPWALVIFLRLCGWVTKLSEDLDYYTLFLSYYIVLLFPFVSLLSLPDLKVRLKKLLFWRRVRRLVHPERDFLNNPDLAI